MINFKKCSILLTVTLQEVKNQRSLNPTKIKYKYFNKHTKKEEIKEFLHYEKVGNPCYKKVLIPSQAINYWLSAGFILGKGRKESFNFKKMNKQDKINYMLSTIADGKPFRYEIINNQYESDM